MSSRLQFQISDLQTALIISVFVLQMFFFAPMLVLVQNFGEFSVRFVDLVMIHLALSFGLIVILYQLVRRLNYPVLLAALVFFSFIAFLESRFLLAFAGHHPFDGQPIDWDSLRWLSFLELGAIFVIGALFAGIRRETKLLSLVSIFILVFLTAGFLHQILINHETLLPGRSINRVESVYFDQFYRLSNKRNIIHIVPDQAQGALLHDILASDPERYAGVFDGFTLFTQSVGRYKGTYPSVVYYMAGEAPEPENDLVINQPFTWDFIEQTLQQRSIVSVLSQNGFNTFGFQFHPGIFCKGPFTACIGTHDEIFAGVAVSSPRRRVVRTVLTLLDLAFFQMTPIVVREQVHDDGLWFARKLATGSATHSGVLDIFTDRMQAGENPDTYNYFHHAGAHAPLLFDRHCNYIGPQEINWQNQREQVTCTLLQLEKMIQALKATGVYDQTMIVINGDHGSPWLPPSTPTHSGEFVSKALMGMASTLVLIKPPETRGPLQFSNQAVTIGDIPATIADAFRLDAGFPGVPMFGGEFGADRERHYYDYDSSSEAHSLQALLNMTRYRIRGNVFDERDWVLPNQAIAGEHPSQLRMNHAGFLNYTQGFSTLEHHDFPVRWVDGTQARVSLSPPGQGGMALVFESFVPPSIVGQWMEVSVAGHIIARFDEQALKVRRHIIPLPTDLPRAELLEIEFTMGKTRSTRQDPRQRSVLFSYIGLEPAG